MVAGAEAMFADLGHFSVKSIQVFFFIVPSLEVSASYLNYDDCSTCSHSDLS